MLDTVCFFTTGEHRTHNPSVRGSQPAPDSDFVGRGLAGNPQGPTIIKQPISRWITVTC